MPYFFCKKSASVNLKKVLTTCDSYCILLPVLNKAVRYARVAQLVEHDLAKVGVAGSSPVSRSFYFLSLIYFTGIPVPVSYLSLSP